jgi:MFS family permease
MYPSLRTRKQDWVQDDQATGDQPGKSPGWRGIDPNVFAIGFTSMFTDISSEMVNPIIPIYLTYQLGFSFFQIALFTGIYSGITAVSSMFGATIADRLNRYKEVAGVGYSVSAFCKLGLLLSKNAWVAATGFLYLDRTGKAMRTAPRDALISLSSSPERLGESFGVHRALDTTGAVIGPLLAFALLLLTPGKFSTIFVVSFCIALFGLAILVLFVRNRKVKTADAAKKNRVIVRDVIRLLRKRSYASICFAGVALGLVTIADPLIYLAFQRESKISLAFFPLFYVGTSVVYLMLAVPFGRLADRIGRSLVFLGGFGFLGLVYATLLIPNPGLIALLFMLTAFGTYYAATDGVLAAIASAALPAEIRTSGLALLDGAVAVAGFVSSLAFGALWSVLGPAGAIRIFLVALVVALLAASFVLLRSPRQSETGSGGFDVTQAASEPENNQNEVAATTGAAV